MINSAGVTSAVGSGLNKIIFLDLSMTSQTRSKRRFTLRLIYQEVRPWNTFWATMPSQKYVHEQPSRILPFGLSDGEFRGAGQSTRQIFKTLRNSFVNKLDWTSFKLSVFKWFSQKFEENMACEQSNVSKQLLYRHFL